LKFLADGMLGKLARWLRMLGHDVIYDNGLGDNELLELAKKESRVLLTKDLELYKRAAFRDVETFYVEGTTEPERLAEVANRYGLALVIDMDKSHCPVCNTSLKLAQKELLRNELQTNTYVHYDKFWKCPACGQIYWQGAHWKQINNTLDEAQKKLEKTKEKEA
jgi:uncharacterized protein with PIN domain